MKTIGKLLLFKLLPFFMLLFFMLLLVGGGGGSAPAQPVQQIASVEKANEYGIICSELGVPWELVILTDAFYGVQADKTSIEDVNPVYTAMQFLVVTEKKEERREKYNEDPDAEVEYYWATVETKKYVGKNNILSYSNIKGDPADLSSSKLIASIKQIVEDKNKGLSDERYLVEITVNQKLESVLRDIIKLEPENVKIVIDLYEEHYLAQLYFKNDYYYFGNYNLPEVTVGDISRMELLKIATSLIGHPYGWGEKSWGKGPPVGPLDCSGFVDWVFIQGFGKPVSGNYLPNGINMSGTALQYYNCKLIFEDPKELKIGDIAFYDYPWNITTTNHVGIYVGEINGKKAFVHCGGKWFGYQDRPTGRVGISINDQGIYNDFDNIRNTHFTPAMKGTRFKVFARPNFMFNDDLDEAGKKEDDDIGSD